MTCIVGLVDQGTVYIGGDSAGTAGWATTIRADSKVWEDGEFIFGFTTSFRMGQLLKHSLHVREQLPSESVEQYLCTTFIDAVRDCLKTGGFAEIKNSSEEGGTFLLGYRGRLFIVADDFQVGESLSGFDACGSGGEAARGAMHATEDLPARERIDKALKAAEALNAAVAGPFVIRELKSK